MPKFNFEVKVQRDDRWVLDRVFDSEALAIKHADTLAASNQYQGVRVVKDRLKADGTFSSGGVIYEKKGQGPVDKNVSIVPIDKAASCATVEDVYRLDSRETVWKVLRKYFEATIITPSEVLYYYGALARLVDNDPPVYASAIDRIATVQARAEGGNARERRDELFQWGDIISARAREAEREKALRRHSLDNFKALSDAALDWGGPKRRDFLIRHVIARQLYGVRNWLAKLDLLLGAASPQMEWDDLAILDGFIADILGSTSVIQEVLGPRNNLCDALIGLIDLMEGKEDEANKNDELQIVAVLRRTFAEGRLPAAAQVLLERIRGQLSGSQPLDRHNPDREQEAFLRLLGRLSTAKGITGGAAMAEALTQRYGLQLPQGGDTGRRMAVGAMINLIRDPVQRVRYLLSIAETETGRKAMDVLVSSIREITDGATDVHSFVNPGHSATKKMMIITDLQRALLDSKLPEDARKSLFDRLDDLLADFVQRDGFIARLDDPSLELRERALRLVKFCSSGLLIEGKALALARQRIADHLRQPNFVEKFTANCAGPAEAEKAVRDFYRQLADAGFTV